MASPDGGSQARPQRSRPVTTKLGDPNNIALPATTLHQKARTDHQAAIEEQQRHAEQQRRAEQEQKSKPSTTTSESATATGPPDTTIVIDSSDDDTPLAKGPLKKRAIDDPDCDGSSSGLISSVKKKAKTFKPLETDVTDEDGFLNDLNVQEIPADKPLLPSNTGSRDVEAFFGKPFDSLNAKGEMKKHRNCTKCRSTLVSDVSTLRRHLQAKHEGLYREWALANDFESKLPADKKKRNDALKRERERQTQLDSHLRDLPKKERVKAYSDRAWWRAALEWLIATGQPLNALEHPKFREMIHLASRAQDGVNIPSRKVARREIMRIFHEYMRDLKQKLNSDSVTGDISLTCDAWQADNTDGYFAVTVHFIEQISDDSWELRSALAGFTQVNNAHNGQQLGQALFKVVDRLGIAARIGHVTCDNAKNNGTMLAEFARWVKKKTGRIFDPKNGRINCLAHVINLATQAFIKVYSQTAYYDPASPESHTPDTSASVRDEVGLIRAICVKERSSAKRKEKYRSVQLAAQPPVKTPRQLLLDMKVRWSSTFVMLVRAFEDREHVDHFVFEISRLEKDKAKRQKLLDLGLSEQEWSRVDLFIQLLAHADNRQQSFSSEQNPCLHRAIPALEDLHTAWTRRATKEKYAPFKTALEAGAAKVAEYYDKVADSNAYIVCMYLTPQIKGSYFAKHWPANLRAEAERVMEEIFAERYKKLYGDARPPPHQSKKKASSRRSHTSRRVLSDDETEVEDDLDTSTHTNEKPHLTEFRRYLDTRENISENVSPVQFWGESVPLYPVWASLARDYLAIMATSVSSERAFSQGGITIRKHRNKLKHDVVEALQCLKCSFRSDLISKDPGPSSVTEDTRSEDGTHGENDSDEDSLGSEVQQQSWDVILDSDDEDLFLEGDTAAGCATDV